MRLVRLWEQPTTPSTGEPLQPSAYLPEEYQRVCKLVRVAIDLQKGGADALFQMAKDQKGTHIMQAASKGLNQDGDDKYVVNQITLRLEEYWSSPHANHVLQAFIQNMPGTLFCPVVEKLLEEVTEDVECKCSSERPADCVCRCRMRGVLAARHKFGCRVLERILEHCSDQPVCQQLVKVFTEEHLCVTLMKHNYGNFVMQHVLEHCGDEAKNRIATLLCRHVVVLSRHRISSHVVERAMALCSPEDRSALVSTIVECQSNGSLKNTRYGSFVHRTAGKMRERTNRTMPSAVAALAFRAAQPPRQ